MTIERCTADKRWLDHYGFRPLDLPTLFGGLSS
jgi:phenylalanyl-tRNA synthetase alpha chain